MIKKFLIALPVILFLIFGSYFLAIMNIGVGSSPEALAKKGDILYVFDSGVHYSSDCFCVYHGKSTFQPTIWLIDTKNWKILRHIKVSDSEFNSTKRWILDNEEERLYLDELPSDMISLIETTDESLSKKIFSGAIYSYDTGNEIFIFPYGVTRGKPYGLWLTSFPVKITAVNRESYEIRKFNLSEDPFYQFHIDFVPHFGTFGESLWVDASDIVYVTGRSHRGEKPGVLFVFDSQTGNLKAALELDSPINKIVRLAVSLGNFSILPLFF
ncbi:MAG TPA: hypothetical protein ENI19_03980 [Candidatus Nealsonbacteria bacterium]|uniref:Uncharacterized protein n=1 Tax=marine sediment metagenome TaxID=412755 RepID=A0A0F9WND6_9ZZZZ|nr:hypothetical protein [Candidatus Nealsonbacteria bacterium]HEB46827.1 hypothetical protein [Candidatus Nealsonbacteria bacterium]